MNVTTWMNLGNIILVRKSQWKKEHIWSDSLYIKCLKQANPQRQKIGFQLPQTEEMGRLGMTINGSGVSFCDDGNILEFDSADGCKTLCVY